MGKKQGSAARRAKKKHEKELKRKKAISRRPTPPVRHARWSPRPSFRLLPDLSDLDDEPELDWSRLEDGIEGFMQAENIPSFHEAAEIFEGMFLSGGHRPNWAHSISTIARVEALSTEQIVERLDALGVHASEADFLAAKGPFFSAVEMARALWLPQLIDEAEAFDRDFVLLAAMTLWKRWSPEQLSQEMLLDGLSAGYVMMYDDDPVAALKRWIAFWRALAPRLSPEMRTTARAQALLGRYRERLFNWGSDLSSTARNAAIEKPEIAPAAASVLEDVLAAFSDEDPDWRAAISEDLAVALDRAGQRERAEALLRELIAKHPERAGGYVELSYLLAPFGCEEPHALGQAVALLEQAVAFPVEDGEDYNIDDRLHDLRERLSVAGSTAAA